MPDAVLGTSHEFSHPCGDPTWQMGSLLPLYDGESGELAFEGFAQGRRASKIVRDSVRTETQVPPGLYPSVGSAVL